MLIDVSKRDNYLIRRSNGTDILRKKDSESILRGVGIVYDKPTVLYAGKYITVTEEIAPGCITNMDDQDICSCFNHRADNILARVSNGHLELDDQDDGLYCDIEPNRKTSWGESVFQAVDRGDVYGMSFMARILKETVKEDSAGDKYIIHYRVEEIKLREVGPVTWPQYTQTEIHTAQRMENELCRYDSDTEKEIRRLVEHFDNYKRIQRMKMAEVVSNIRRNSLLRNVS